MLAGQGAAGAAMQALESSGLAEALRDAAQRHVPLLGVCVGLADDKVSVQSSERHWGGGG
jgi:imidazoleglycerol phosphate synthase glutamine amidotransferase subunit HisH